jgi:hypothetical protein
VRALKVISRIGRRSATGNRLHYGQTGGSLSILFSSNELIDCPVRQIQTCVASGDSGMEEDGEANS